MESSADYILFDANIWIAYFNKTEITSNQAKAKITQALSQDKIILVSDYIIQEVMTVLLYQNQHNVIEQFLKFIQKHKKIFLIGIDTYFFQSIIDFIQTQRYIPKISLTDWSLVFLASKFDFTLITFDKQLNNFYKRLTKQISR